VVVSATLTRHSFLLPLGLGLCVDAVAQPPQQAPALVLVTATRRSNLVPKEIAPC